MNQINQRGWIKLALIIIGVILALAGLLLFLAYYFLFSGAKLSDYEYLKEPRLTTMGNQNMMVVSLTGDPDETAGEAISLLYKAYYSLNGVDKSKMLAPRARWQWDKKKYDITDEDVELTGEYGLPIPENIIDVPEKLIVKTWEYGQVAEILHIGDYNNETPTIERLHKFIEDQGYEIVGDHEEEYVKGPSMFGKGNPNKYLTIIRYQVIKK